MDGAASVRATRDGFAVNVRHATREPALSKGEMHDLYRALLDAESDLGQGVVLVRTGDGRIVFVNVALSRLVGVPPDEMLAEGFDVGSLFAEGEKARIVRERAGLDEATPRHYEARLRRRDGGEARIEAASMHVEVAGEAHRLVLCRDITRVRGRDAFLTDATLQILEGGLDPEQTLRLIARLATARLSDYAHVDLLDERAGLRRVVVSSKDPARAALVTRYQEAYPAHPRLRAAIEAIPRGDVLLLNDLPRAKLDEYARSVEERALAEEAAPRHTLVVPLVGRSGLLGALTMTRAEGAPPFDEEDVFIAKSLATRAALTYENARLHQETLALEARSRRLYERHTRILDTAPAQVLTVDASGRIHSINRSVRGVDARVALEVNAFDTVVPEDRARVRAIIEEVIGSGQTAEYETQALLDGGDVRWFHVRAGAVELDGGEKGAVLVSTDVHDRKLAEREMAHVRAQLAKGERLAALGSLVSGVAHELRTPLTFLSNNAFLLEQRLARAAHEGRSAAEAVESVQPFVREIVAGVERIDRLVEDLRKFTRSRMRTETTRAPLDSLLTEAIELFRAASRGAHAVERSLSATRSVRADRGAVQQLALNLLQNAADASPPGSAVRIATRQEGNDAVLEVVDRGCGIPRDVQERMFEPLFTTKPEGTGLGLSIVRRIAEDHRARIEVESEVGAGTTFRVRFPSDE